MGASWSWDGSEAEHRTAVIGGVVPPLAGVFAGSDGFEMGEHPTSGPAIGRWVQMAGNQFKYYFADRSSA